MRKNFIKDIIELADLDPRIVLLTLDVGYPTFDPFIKKYPGRYLNVGISEQNAVSFATGMAIAGKIPFLYSINSFLLFRAFEQIRFLSHMGQHVVLVGSGLGKEYTNYGLSHYSEEDIDILKTLPIKVLTPEDKEDLAKKILEAYKHEGASYIRLSKKNLN